ncbi:hypothetical protein CRM89_09825 [Nocardia sp. FDAARGOS_372]|nr:hypothetical protein CRM89_09825 [Nocardia sp. FDAARGOS_372]
MCQLYTTGPQLTREFSRVPRGSPSADPHSPIRTAGRHPTAHEGRSELRATQAIQRHRPFPVRSRSPRAVTAGDRSPALRAHLDRVQEQLVKTSEDLSSEATLGEAIYAFRAIADAAARR